MDDHQYCNQRQAIINAVHVGGDPAAVSPGCAAAKAAPKLHCDNKVVNELTFVKLLRAHRGGAANAEKVSVPRIEELSWPLPH